MLDTVVAFEERSTAPSPYAPSLRVEKFACGWYGVGHTAQRHPGEMRGTVIGRQGRFRDLITTRGGAV